jgi:glycosyl transferase family 25
MDTIEKVVYINLEHRTDRREQVEAELAVFGDRVERFNAIQKSPGGIGCSMSHLSVLKRAKEQGWKNVLIVEDDFAWTHNQKGIDIFNNLVSKPYDVIVFGGTYAYYYPDSLKLHKCQTTVGYLVANHYYDTLIANYKEGIEGFLRTMNYPVYALDQYWKQIQPRDNWYIVVPNICMQQPGYSDIEKTFVDYKNAYL